MSYFLHLCRKNIMRYLEEKGVICDENEIFVVWSCKTIQNKKAILGTSLPYDNRIYECTLNGDKGEVYLDVYNKEAKVIFEV